MMFGSFWMLFAFVAVILLIYLLSGGGGNGKRAERGRIVCPRCQSEQPFNAQYCGRCGQQLDG